jgi:hypothetical protein
MVEDTSNVGIIKDDQPLNTKAFKAKRLEHKCTMGHSESEVFTLKYDPTD